MMDAARKQRTSLILVGFIGAMAVVLIAGLPPMPQSLSYHDFADRRTLLGIPNFWNVVSNVPFLLVGVIGAALALSGRYKGGLPNLRFVYAAFFAAIASVCFGSAYYHWNPNNSTLVWDRLPMAVGFMIFLSVAISEYINERLGLLLLAPLVALGVFSVWYWHYTETLGRGDLRLYGLVQFLTLLLLGMMFLLFKSRLTGNGYLWAMFGGYLLAKVLEELDAPIYNLGHILSGHALKHIVAAAGMYCFVLALQRRRMVEG